MFIPKLMRKLELIVPERYVVPVTEALAASGSFHLSKSGHVSVEDASLHTDVEWQAWAASFATLERRIKAVMEELGVPEGPPPTEPPHLITPEVAQSEVERLEQEAEEPVRALEEEQRRLSSLQRYLAQLEPIADLNIDLDTVRKMRYTFVLAGTMPAANVERLQSSLEHIPAVLVVLRRTEHLASVVLFGMQRDADILSRAARSAYLNPVTLPDEYRGTPAQAIAALRVGIERAEKRLAQRKNEIAQLRQTRIHQLQNLLWRVRASAKLAETIIQYGRLHYTYLISGWVPAAQVSELQRALAQISEQIVIEVVEPSADEFAQIPVAFDNPPFLRAFQGLVTNYGYPKYGELDPTPVVALTFPLVFGIMFGDVGQGLLLAALGGIIATRKVKPLRRLALIGPVLIACGLSSMIFGLVYGSIFGSERLLRPLWIRPLDNILSILFVTVGIGIAILNIGMLYNIANALVSRHLGHAVFDRNGLAGLVFYWSLLGLGASLLMTNFPISRLALGIAAGVSGLVLMFAEPLQRLMEKRRPLIEGGFGTYLVQAFVELFEVVIGLFSNTLSYVRMGAFAVAHSSLSLVITILANLISPNGGIVAWMILALGNLFILGFEGMIVAIQTLRLEYYELFSKFFYGGGARFQPLSLIPKGET